MPLLHENLWRWWEVLTGCEFATGRLHGAEFHLCSSWMSAVNAAGWSLPQLLRNVRLEQSNVKIKKGTQ